MRIDKLNKESRNACRKHRFKFLKIMESDIFQYRDLMKFETIQNILI